MQKGVKTILGKGLCEGYMGKTARGKVDRAGFTLEISDYKGPEGTYHDEWFAHQNGGGQELVETPDGKHATRVYAGGNLPQEDLTKLGITENEVIQKLLFFVNEAGEKTRQDTDTESTNGDWKYNYEVLDEIKEIPLVVGKESIFYKDTLVFVHFHINSPIK
jgi:hypothetical protein